MIGVDEPSIRLGSARAAMEAAKRFIAQLGPDDLVGLVAYPQGMVRVEPTNNHAQVIAGLDKVRALVRAAADQVQHLRGRGDRHRQQQRRHRGAGRRARMRRPRRTALHGVHRQVKMEGQALGIALEATLAQSLGGLRGLLNDMGTLPGRKILVMISGGMAMSDKGVGRGDETGRMFDIGRIAAQTNTSLYALHMDTRFLDAYAERKVSHTIFRDETIFNAGLEKLAAAAGGTVFRVRTGSGDPAFSRVLLETSAQYLLGVDVPTEDRGSKTAQIIKVKVKPKGATVRHRMSVVIPK